MKHREYSCIVFSLMLTLNLAPEGRWGRVICPVLSLLTFPLVFFPSFSRFLSVSFASHCFLLLNIYSNVSVTQGSFLSPFPPHSSNSPWAIASGGFTYHLYTNNPKTCISDKPHLFSSIMFELSLVEKWSE